MEARQRAQLTGTNRSSDLIALVAKPRCRPLALPERRSEDCPSDHCSSITDHRPQFCFIRKTDSRTTDSGDILRFPISGFRPRYPFFAGLVALARRSDPIPSRTRPSNALAPMVLCLKTWESRSSPGLPRTEIGQPTPDDRGRMNRSKIVAPLPLQTAFRKTEVGQETFIRPLSPFSVIR